MADLLRRIPPPFAPSSTTQDWNQPANSAVGDKKRRRKKKPFSEHPYNQCSKSDLWRPTALGSRPLGSAEHEHSRKCKEGSNAGQREEALPELCWLVKGVIYLAFFSTSISWSCDQIVGGVYGEWKKCRNLVQGTLPLGVRGGRPLFLLHTFSHLRSRATFSFELEWHFQELAGSFISLEASQSAWNAASCDCRLTDDEDVMMMAWADAADDSVSVAFFQIVRRDSDKSQLWRDINRAIELPSMDSWKFIMRFSLLTTTVHWLMAPTCHGLRYCSCVK